MEGNGRIASLGFAYIYLTLAGQIQKAVKVRHTLAMRGGKAIRKMKFHVLLSEEALCKENGLFAIID